MNPLSTQGNIDTRNKGLRDYNFNLASNVPVYLDVTGNFFGVVAATGAVTITFDDSQSINRYQNMGGEVPQYKRVQVSSATAQTVTLALGFGGMYDNRTSLTATINATIASPNTVSPIDDLSVPATTALQLAGAVTTRRSIFIYNSDSSPGVIRIGDNSVSATKGIPIMPGTGVNIDCTAAISVYNPNATAATVSALETKQI